MDARPAQPAGDRGAYGFRLSGVDVPERLLVPAPREWPVLEIEHRTTDRLELEHEVVGESRAELQLAAGGWVELGRSPLRAVYHMPERPSDDGLVHPFLVPAAALAARWLGRESFHAGAVVIGDGAWAVVGDKEAGKSSALAWLARAGHPVLADDLLVLDGGRALAGPRSIDLRESAAMHLQTGEALGRLGVRDRWRVTLPPVAAAVPLRGWIVLGWHDGPPELVPVRGAGRLEALTPHRAVRLVPRDPAELVRLSSLPVYELRRRREWAALAAMEELLAGTLAA